MAVDYSPYQIIPETTACRMAEDLALAIEMAKAHYPHLVDRLEFTQKRYWETAIGFTGSEKIPASARKLFIKGDQK